MAQFDPDALVTLSATQLAAAIARGEATAHDAVEAHIARIQAVNPALNAVVVQRFDAARAEARAADRRRAAGEPLGPLHGVPITVKECLDVVGTPSTFGMPSRRGDLPAANDPFVDRLVAAGAIILGKTNVPQAVIYNESSNALYGRTHNPWNTARTPGGSSGGEGAIIAAGGSPLGLGTDVGGSLRLPAHFCGIASLKPTALRTHDYSRFSEVPLEFGPITSVAGPLARDVDDLTLAMRVIGEVPHPRLPVPRPLGDPAAVDVAGLRVGWYVDDGIAAPSPAIQRAVREAAAALSARGATVMPWSPPDLARAEALYLRLLTGGGAQPFRAALANDRPEPQIAVMYWLARQSPATVRRLRAALGALGQRSYARQLDSVGDSAGDVPRCAAEAAEYAQTFAAAMDAAGGGPLDVILSPACFSAAWLHGASRELGTGGAYCVVYNLLGYPAGVVPVTRVRADEVAARPRSLDVVVDARRKVEAGSTGLPIGVQVAARPWQEHAALAAMRAVQDAARRQPDYPRTPV